MTAPAEVRSALKARGWTMLTLAARHGVAYQYLNKALVCPSMKGNRIIATALGLEMHELWPDWFRADGSRTSKVGPTMYERLIRRVEAGERIWRVVAEPGMPDRATLWLYRKRHPEYDARMRRAMGRRPGTDAALIGAEDLDRIVEALAAGVSLRAMQKTGLVSCEVFRKFYRADPDFAARVAPYYQPRPRLDRPHTIDEQNARRRARYAAKAALKRTKVDVWAIAEAAVSKRLPPEARNDVKADLALALLTGEVRPDQAKAKAKALATAWNREFGGWDVSLDQDMGGGATLHGLLLEEKVAAGW